MRNIRDNFSNHKAIELQLNNKAKNNIKILLFEYLKKNLS